MTDSAGRAAFDFAAFRRAFEAKDAAAWLAFFAEDAEWIEYKHTHPPRAPKRMVGKAAIGAFLEGVAGAPITLSVSDEVIGEGRCAFCVTCVLPDGRRIIEHVILHLADGRVVRQVDVEAWD